MRQILSPQLTLLPIVLSLMGCSAITPFHRTHLPDRIQQEGKGPTDRVEIVIGEPDPILQRLAYVVETPARILPFCPKPPRHQISATTTEMITSYLEQHELSGVYVCVNEYDPVGEWKRLTANHAIGPGWRYSLGILSLAQYTLFPQPVFGTNQYNPFTNRLSIELDEPVALLYEAAYAKDVRGQSLPGTYAAMSMLPGISLVRELRAVNDVARFAQASEDWELEKGVYRKLYPRVGAGSVLIGMVILPLWWEQAICGVVGPASGYVVGRMMESRRERELTSMTSTLPTEETNLAPLSVEKIPNWVFIEEDPTDPEVRQTAGP
ncbi:MAG: hypothetical protein JSS49_30795 [Planctomycetes bacterium]|nr:hypothetical protein [Planctomycetota bacterium]